MVGSAGVEERTMGALSWGVVSLYVMAAGGFLWLGSVMAMYIMEQMSKILTDRWVGWWAEDRCPALLTSALQSCCPRRILSAARCFLFCFAMRIVPKRHNCV